MFVWMGRWVEGGSGGGDGLRICPSLPPSQQAMALAEGKLEFLLTARYVIRTGGPSPRF